MTNKFVTVLDSVGAALKKFFTSPVASDIVTTGIDIAEIVLPQADTLLDGLQKSYAQAVALAASANTGSDSTSQVAALVLADAQQIFQTYEQATGKTFETATEQQIVADLIALLNNFVVPAPLPAAGATTS